MRKNCKQCGKKRTPPKAFNYVSRQMWEADEFCTAKCAKTFHGVIDLKGHTARDYGEVT